MQQNVRARASPYASGGLWAAGGKYTGLKPAVRNTPVTDIIDNDLVTFVHYLIYHPVVTDTNPVQMLSTGKLVGIMRDRFL